MPDSHVYARLVERVRPQVVGLSCARARSSSSSSGSGRGAREGADWSVVRPATRARTQVNAKYERKRSNSARRPPQRVGSCACSFSYEYSDFQKAVSLNNYFTPVLKLIFFFFFFPFFDDRMKTIPCIYDIGLDANGGQGWTSAETCVLLFISR